MVKDAERLYKEMLTAKKELATALRRLEASLRELPPDEKVYQEGWSIGLSKHWELLVRRDEMTIARIVNITYSR